MQRLIVTVDASEVQGEGTWVKVRKVDFGEKRRFMALAQRMRVQGAAQETAQTLEDDALKPMAALVARGVLEWNWTDAEGDPLPLPREADGDAAIDHLLEEEVTFLAGHILGTRPEAQGRLEASQKN
jgi:hypothetical protein